MTKAGKEQTQAIDEIKSVIKQLGFTKEQTDEAKKDLARYMPREVFFEKYGNEKGMSLLYAIYAPQVLRDYFMVSRESRRRRFEESGARGALDFVQNVMMGYHEPQPRNEEYDRYGKETPESLGHTEKGILSVAVPPKGGKQNPDAYDPTRTAQERQRPSICPHCKVSFWSKSSGNCDPKYKVVGGKQVAEWRETEEQAPEHIKYNITTGEKATEGAGGYDFCGGRHEIFPVTTPGGGLDVEKAELISKISFEQLKAADRIRQVDRNGRLEYFLVDEYLKEVERQLREVPGGDKTFKHFGSEWIEEKDGKFYRECRHAIDLKSPASVIRDRIKLYQPTGGKKSGIVTTIDVYKCPKPDCPGQFYDREGITKGKEGAKTNIVQCDTCGQPFDVTELPEDFHRTVSWVQQQKSLDVSFSAGDDDEGSTLGETILGHEDSGLLAVEMTEILGIIEEELDRISKSLNVQGAEYAKQIFMANVIDGDKLREITEKFFPGRYRLHFTECLDCGHKVNEKSNPQGDAVGRYDRGMPVNMIECPMRSTDPRHKTPPPKQEEPTEVSPFESLTVKEPGLYETDTETAREVSQRQKVEEQIQDPTERRRFLGTNLVYHGRPTEGTDTPGTSYLVDIEHGSSQPLPAGDPRSYKGEDGPITLYPYAPAKRILNAIQEALKNSPRLKSKKDVMEMVDMWGDSIKHIANTRPYRRFCR